MDQVRIVLCMLLLMELESGIGIGVVRPTPSDSVIEADPIEAVEKAHIDVPEALPKRRIRKVPTRQDG